MSKIKYIYRYFRNFYRELDYPKYMNFASFKFKFRFSKLKIDMKEYLFVHHQTYEYGERYFCEKLLSNDDIVIEAGTSIGILTGVISNIIGSNGRIYTIEADENLIKIAKSINKKNNNIFYNHGMLLTKNRPDIHFQPDGWLGGKVVENNQSFCKLNNIKLFNLYELIISFEPNALVLDIEGEELGLITMDIPYFVKKIIIELHPGVYGDTNCIKIQEHLHKQNFVFQGCFENTYSFLRS